MGQPSACRHPVVVISDMDRTSRVKVAMVKHNHPTNTPTVPANDYAAFDSHPVLGASSINVGQVKTIDRHKLQPVPAHHPPAVQPHKFQQLIQHISTYVLE